MENHPQETITNPEENRKKVLEDINAHLRDIKEQLRIEFFLYNDEAYDLHTSWQMKKSQEDKLSGLDTPLSNFRPLLGLYNGEIIQGGRYDLHNYLRERIADRDFGPDTPRITDISGFSMVHKNYPDIPVILFNREFTDEQKTTFAPLFKTLRDQHAVVINEQAQEITLP